jgi:hypothetical protein
MLRVTRPWVNVLAGRPGKIAMAVVMILLLSFVGWHLPGGSDWYQVVRPATLRLLEGRSPYGQPTWYSPVWVMAPFIPLALLPPQLGRAVLFAASLCAYTFSAVKMGARPAGVAAFLISPPIVVALWLSSIDWIPFLGYVLPPQIGLFFLTAKPQLGIAVAAFWLVESARRGWREVIRVFAPITISLGVLFLIYGIDPFLGAASMVDMPHNASLWPTSLPLGLTLLVAALRKRELRFSIATGPCLSPYVMITSWGAPFLAIASFTPELIAAVVGAWILAMMRSGF